MSDAANYVKGNANPLKKLKLSSLLTSMSTGVRCPEDWNIAGGQILGLALVISWIITLIFIPDTITGSILTVIVGYPNLCVGWDESPAVYLASGLYMICIVCQLRYTQLSLVRVNLMSHITWVQWFVAYVGNIILCVAFCASYLIFCIAPTWSPLFHSLAFVQLMVAYLLSYVSSFFASDPKYHPRGSYLFLTVHAVCALGFGTLAVIQLLTYEEVDGEVKVGPVPAYVTIWFDYGWFITLIFLVKFAPPAPSICFNRYLKDDSEDDHTRCRKRNPSMLLSLWLTENIDDGRIPEDWHTAAAEVCILSLLVTWIVHFTVPEEHALEWDLKAILGYTSPWSVWDERPAFYVGAAMVPMIIGCKLRAAQLGIIRNQLMRETKSRKQFIVTYVVDGLLCLSYFAGSVTFVIRPGESEFTHWFLLLQFVVGNYAEFLLSFYITDPHWHLRGSYVFSVIYGLFTIGFVALACIQLMCFDRDLADQDIEAARGPIDKNLLLVLDYGLISMLAVRENWRPKGRAVGFHCELVENERFCFELPYEAVWLHEVTTDDDQARFRANAGLYSSWCLNVVLAVVSPVSTCLSLLSAFGRRCVGWSGVTTPDAIGAAAPVPRFGLFAGDIIGYFAFKRNPLDMLNKAARMGGVVAINVGRAAVWCLDCTSTSTIAATGDGVIHDNLDKLCSSLMPNGQLGQVVLDNLDNDILDMDNTGQMQKFLQRGAKTKQIRAFIQALIPSNEDDVRFLKAVGTFHEVLAKWAALPEARTVQLDGEQAVLDVLLTFSSMLFLGCTVDPELMGYAFKFCSPFIVPVFPYIPPQLFPEYWRAKRAHEELALKFKACPNSKTICLEAEKAGLKEEEAVEALIIAMSYHTYSACASFLNALLVIPHIESEGSNVARDPELLDSVAWELLRHNGPLYGRTTPNDLDITTSTGTKHRVKAGTRLFAHLAYSMRDGTIYEDPHVFKPDRFKPLPPRDLGAKAGPNEPLPTLAFGCPLGFIDDPGFKDSQQCAFLHLAQPLVRHWVSVLANGFHWETYMTMKPATTNSPCFGALDFSIDNLMGTGVTSQMVPKSNYYNTLRFRFFLKRSKGMTIAEVELAKKFALKATMKLNRKEPLESATNIGRNSKQDRSPARRAAAPKPLAATRVPAAREIGHATSTEAPDNDKCGDGQPEEAYRANSQADSWASAASDDSYSIPLADQQSLQVTQKSSKGKRAEAPKPVAAVGGPAAREEYGRIAGAASAAKDLLQIKGQELAAVLKGAVTPESAPDRTKETE